MYSIIVAGCKERSVETGYTLNIWHYAFSSCKLMLESHVNNTSLGIFTFVWEKEGLRSHWKIDVL